MTSTSTINRLDQALQRLGTEMDPFECHGMLVGLFCAVGQLKKDEWFGYLAPAPESGDLLADEAFDALGELYEETARQLSDPLLNFYPLVPDDDDTLADRTEALGTWCQGFLLALSQGGITETDKLPGDVPEVIRDLVELSSAGGYELAEDSEEDENAYSELLEYVRTAVLLVNEELNPIKAAPMDPKNLH